MWIDTQGFKEVSKELKRMRDAQVPAITKAIDDAAVFGKNLAVDKIFNKFGYKSKSYVEDTFFVSIHPNDLTAHISARFRATSLTRMAKPRYRTGKKGQSVLNGYDVSAYKNQPVWFKGAFTIIGQNGNQVMFMRKRKDNSWRKIGKQKAKKAGTKDQKPLYGPSVWGAFKYMRDDIEPPIIKHLRERYGHHAK
ncbi:hypothetical protein [Shewanella sp. HL-SH2]|uniref:hypothetical protein n=1 Tax=Shewanella sp. HL-SH2 TaxID=3436238 RepID=UPI003EBFB038